LPKER
jgi:calpain-15